MSIRTRVARWLGGAPYPQDIADRLETAVDDLYQAIDELRSTSQLFGERQDHGT